MDKDSIRIVQNLSNENAWNPLDDTPLTGAIFTGHIVSKIDALAGIIERGVQLCHPICESVLQWQSTFIPLYQAILLITNDPVF